MKVKLKLLLQISLALLIAGSFTLSTQAADAEAGKAKSALCAGCHGLDGKGLDALIPGQPISPRIAGQFEGYLSKSMAEYKSKVRADPLMGAIAGGLSDDDIANLSAYFASIK